MVEGETDRRDTASLVVTWDEPRSMRAKAMGRRYWLFCAATAAKFGVFGVVVVAGLVVLSLADGLPSYKGVLLGMAIGFAGCSTGGMLIELLTPRCIRFAPPVLETRYERWHTTQRRLPHDFSIVVEDMGASEMRIVFRGNGARRLAVVGAKTPVAMRIIEIAKVAQGTFGTGCSVSERRLDGPDGQG